MLSLKNIVKDYAVGDEVVHALRGVSIDFRKSEFVSVLGQSGCGKTTLLNIIGGLDKYTSGDLIINGKSTKEYKDRDWDTYRNHSIGFVFQSYNLIPHQTVLANVELALTLSGVSKSQRRQRAIEALTRVGLADQIHKKPNQMSGGQMQRVAIARALVNDPDILLADEPTGALDSETSVAIMEILKEISKDKLIIMVTHNPELAQQYSNRIIKLLDGEVISDSSPYEISEEEAKKLEAEAANAAKVKKTSMSFFTALSLSLNNLMTKKGRTFLTSFAGSIGIIGIALILSLSNGVQEYIDRVQEETLSSYPLQIDRQTVDYSDMFDTSSDVTSEGTKREDDKIYSNDVMYGMMNTMMSQVITNNLKDFKAFLEDENDGIRDYVSDIQYRYTTPLNIYRADTSDGLVQVNPTTIFEDMYAAMGIDFTMSDSASSMYTGAMSMMGVWGEMLDNEELLNSQYDVLAGRMPEKYNEVVFIVDEHNGISDYALYALGLLDFSEIEEMLDKAMKGEPIEENIRESTSYTFDEILSLEFKLMLNTDYFVKQDGKWVDKSKDSVYIASKLAESETIKIVGIIRPSEDAVATSASGNIGYRSDLMEMLITRVNESEIVKEQKANPDIDVFTGVSFESVELTEEMLNEYIASLPEEEQAQMNGYIQQMESAGTSMEDILKLFSEQMNMSTSATYDSNLAKLGVADLDDPQSILIFPKDFESKDAIVSKINDYNEKAGEGNEIVYTDMVGLMMSSVTTIINAISYILIAFVAISLVVSSIMIGIITYISVLERTKEIGILRAIGASKKDISRVFNAETLIVGFCAGAIGIGVTLLLNIPINMIVVHLTDIRNLAKLPVAGGVILVLISMLLTFIAGLVPSRFAAKKDPVIALRSE
ncbi:MAG: ABC transporter ATP-binding protein/permease [Oscillospiraceae bacterium]|nr:ABC transporter ATP-binding protein/permease [Oscillospiraceae bacterium]